MSLRPVSAVSTTSRHGRRALDRGGEVEEDGQAIPLAAELVDELGLLERRRQVVDRGLEEGDVLAGPVAPTARPSRRPRSPRRTPSIPIGTRRSETIPFRAEGVGLVDELRLGERVGGDDRLEAAERRPGSSGRRRTGRACASGGAPSAAHAARATRVRGPRLASEEEQREAVDLEDPADLRDGPVQELLKLDALDERERELREKTIPYAALGVRTEFLGHDGGL